jgi:hypothetical protein
MKNKYTWFRFYVEAVNDPKVQRLEPTLFRTWVNLLCLARLSDGILPSVDEIAFTLRLSSQDAQAHIDQLICAGLVDILPDRRLTPHNWELRQYDSDSSASRTRKYRARLKEETSHDRHGDVTVTVQTQTQKERIYNKPSTVDRARSSEIENSNLMVSVNARRQAAVLCRVGDPEPIVAAYLAWPKRGVIQDVDAHFVASAAKIYARLKPAQRAACQPLDDPEPLPPVRASSALRAKLAKGKPHGR